MIVASLVNQLDFTNADLLVDARPILGSGLRGSNWATNGSALLLLLRRLPQQAREGSVQTAHKSTPNRPIQRRFKGGEET
jgi:hypothetical protein